MNVRKLGMLLMAVGLLITAGSYVYAGDCSGGNCSYCATMDVPCDAAPSGGMFCFLQSEQECSGTENWCVTQCPINLQMCCPGDGTCTGTEVSCGEQVAKTCTWADHDWDDPTHIEFCGTDASTPGTPTGQMCYVCDCGE